MIKDYIPLLSVIAGGLLTVVGGFVANYLLQSKARKSERIKLISEKLEEAYLLSHDVDAWVVRSLKEMAMPSSEASEKADNPIDRIVMLIKLYEPSLSEVVLEFSGCVKNFASCTFTYWKETYEANSKLPAKRFEELIKEPLDNFHTSHERLLSSIERVTHERLGF